MFRRLVLALVVSVFALPVTAQTVDQARINNATFTRAVVGPVTAVAIPPLSVIGNLLGFRVCADSTNTSYVAVGTAADVDTDGVRLGPNQCFACDGCLAVVLKSIKVKGGAAAQGYAVVQYKKH